MSDDNPFKRQPSLQLTVAQQDRAAGLLVGMAVGESLSASCRDARGPRHRAGGITNQALTAIEEDEPLPLTRTESPDLSTHIGLAFGYFGGRILRSLHRKPESVFSEVHHTASRYGETIALSVSLE